MQPNVDMGTLMQLMKLLQQSGANAQTSYPTTLGKNINRNVFQRTQPAAKVNRAAQTQNILEQLRQMFAAGQ
jgi:hypothetical protein